MENLTPRQIVEALDRYIVGQAEAKRAVAVALRNRYRRQLLDEDLKDEIIPKNILMIGPTGVGKTEIARRLARLVKAPFVKVEATKFTEVGYVGRDVDSMVRDLIETSIRMVRQEKMVEVQDRAEQLAEERLLDLLHPPARRDRGTRNPLELLFGNPADPSSENEAAAKQQWKQIEDQREILRRRLRRQEFEDHYIEVEVADQYPSMVEVFSGSGVEELGINLQDMLGGMFPKKKRKRKVTVAEARKIVTNEEAQKLIDMDEVVSQAVNRAEQSGIIFLDEIDKITGQDGGYGPDVSRGGVQRDILPIVEGSTIMTKYGPVKTDYILFIAAGAFHTVKPSDLIPELQGRFPVRVELQSLTQADFKQILIEPRNSLIKQYTALLGTEGLEIEFLEDGVEEIAEIAFSVNSQTENIGARRLHTILEKLMEDLSFNADTMQRQKFTINKDYVRSKLEGIAQNDDLSRYIL
ncbi:MAG: ATP-dependent protease ATPase subunit HslU [Syntrophomonadaceae bacterium]|nr:ATP-dependent protease ATPase subunit HslU [Syntrophomonadaceae bacterium]